MVVNYQYKRRLLHRQGLTPQKPLRRAYERDPVATDKWVKKDYVRIRSRAKQRKAEIFWLDEASIRSDDPLQRTWGLKGQDTNCSNKWAKAVN